MKSGVRRGRQCDDALRQEYEDAVVKAGSAELQTPL